MDNKNLVFLISAAYSGGTLFSILMNQHPKISSDGEIFPYIRGSAVGCSCGKEQIECEYYRTVAKHMLKKNKQNYDYGVFYYVPKYSNYYPLSRAFEGFWMSEIAKKLRNFFCFSIPKFRKLEQEFVSFHLEFFSNSLKLRNAIVYFDGTKSVRRAEFFAERKLTSRIIHLIRDGRAFCNSFLKNKNLDREYLPVAAKVWEKSIKKMDILKKRFPFIEVLDVRYNDLSADPKKELKRIFDFLDLSYDDSYLVYKKDDMHILGNRMRFNYSGTIREDLSWKKELGQNDVLLANRLMGKNLKRFKFL